MNVTRRTFLKVTGATGATAAASHFLFGNLSTLKAVGESAPEGQATPVEEWIPTTCWIGKQDCGMLARRINGRVVKFVGHPNHPRNQGTLCPKGVGQIAALYDPNRVKTPLIRTNGKNEPGQFRPASWDEALTLVAERMNDVRNRDPRLFVWQKGRSKAKKFYDKAFVGATGATKLHHGAFCSDAGYRAAEYTVGCHGVLHPDFKYTNYLLAWGWNITNAGGNKTCWLTWNQQLLEAMERGIKVVAIDPRRRAASHFADEWVPLRPGTDLALALALCHRVIQQGTVDWDYLKRHSNAGFLVQEDGRFLRIDEKEQVWDRVSQGPKPFDAAGIDPALEGSFTADGKDVKPAFELFKEQIAEYTPRWAAGVCGIPADTIESIARKLGDNAMIGSTTVIDGVEVPLRPVGIMTYHLAQQELGFQQVRAQILLLMLLGAMGAAGGSAVDWTWKVHKNYKKLDEVEIKEETNIYLKNSKFYPINSNNSSVVAKVMQDPAKYGVDYVPEVAILHHVNPMTSFLSQPDIVEAYKKLKFVAVIDPWLSKTADLFADVVLPAATIEKYEGPHGATDQYTDAVALRIPPMDPMFDSRGDIDIYMDLCEKAGLLFGEGGYLDEVNGQLGLEGDFALPIDRKPTVREIFDRWAKSEGISDGVSYFERNGVKIEGPVSPKKKYGYPQDPPFGGVIHRLYGESLLRYAEQMKAMGADSIYWQDYTPLPAWRTPTMERSPGQYDLYLTSFHMIEFKQSRASMVPLLAELAPKQRIDINPRTAELRGIRDGDEVWVESHNGLTGETRRIKTEAQLTNGIRPDTIAMPHHYGEVARHPVTEGQGPTPNYLFFTGEGYVSNTADQSYHVKVKVWKA